MAAQTTRCRAVPAKSLSFVVGPRGCRVEVSLPSVVHEGDDAADELISVSATPTSGVYR